MQAQLETEPPAQESPPMADPTAPLPALVTAHAPEEIIRKLDAAARRGRMAGFQREPAPFLFSVDAFAEPFEHKLLATPHSGNSTRLTFSTTPYPKVPAIFAIVLISSIWPGIWITHSMIVSWFSFYPSAQWVTWAWYLPLTLLCIPWLIKKWKKSKIDSHADALVQIGKLAKELDGTIVGGSGSSAQG